jgi:tetratricopeptide (TPR) repeat protein
MIKDRKKYFAFKALLKYEEALHRNFDDNVLKVKLLSNRAYCNLLLKNFGRVILDCKEIIKRDVSFEKAYFRWTTALFELSKFDECAKVCDLGLKQNPKFKELKRIKEKTLKALKQLAEKKKLKELEESKEMQKLISVLNSKKILLSLSSSIKKHEIYNRRLELNSNDELVIPIVFIYPQFGQFDIVEKVSEKEALIESVKKVVAGGLPWDQNNEYVDFGEMEFFLQLNKGTPVNDFRDKKENLETTLYKLDKLVMVNGTVLDILNTENYVLPTVMEIVVLSKKSSFYEHFMEKFLDYLN